MSSTPIIKGITPIILSDRSVRKVSKLPLVVNSLTVRKAPIVNSLPVRRPIVVKPLSIKQPILKPLSIKQPPIRLIPLKPTYERILPVKQSTSVVNRVNTINPAPMVNRVNTINPAPTVKQGNRINTIDPVKLPINRVNILRPGKTPGIDYFEASDGMGFADWYEVHYENPGTPASIAEAKKDLLSRISSKKSDQKEFIFEGALRYAYHYGKARKALIRDLDSHFSDILYDGTKTGMLRRRAKVTFTFQSQSLGVDILEAKKDLKRSRKGKDVDMYGNVVKMHNPNFAKIYRESLSNPNIEHVNIILGGQNIAMTKTLKEYMFNEISKLEVDIAKLQEKDNDIPNRVQNIALKRTLQQDIRGMMLKINDYMSGDAEKLLSQGIIPDEIPRKRLGITTKILIGAAILAAETGVPVMFRLRHQLDVNYGYEKDNVVYIVYPDLKIENLDDPKTKLYGFFKYMLPENLHGFNVKSNLDCILTCLLYNPEFAKYIDLEELKKGYDIDGGISIKPLIKLYMNIYSKMGITYLEDLSNYEDLKDGSKMRQAHQILSEISGKKKFIVVYKTTHFDLAELRSQRKNKDLEEYQKHLKLRDDILQFIYGCLLNFKIKIDPRNIRKPYEQQDINTDKGRARFAYGTINDETFTFDIGNDIEPREIKFDEMPYIKGAKDLVCYYSEEVIESVHEKTLKDDDRNMMVKDRYIEVCGKQVLEWVGMPICNIRERLPTVKEYIDEALRVLEKTNLYLKINSVEKIYTDKVILDSLTLDEIDKLNSRVERQYILYPDNKEVKVSECPDIPMFLVRKFDRHVFNENTEEAGLFLTNNLLFVERDENKTSESNINRRRKRLPLRPDIKHMKAKLAWNGIRRCIYLNHQKKNPNVIYDTIRFYDNQVDISSDYGNFMSKEEHLECVRKEAALDENEHIKLSKIKKDIIKKNKRYKLFEKHIRVGYVSADLETFNIVNNNGKAALIGGCLKTDPYSIGWKMFDEMGVVIRSKYEYNKVSLTVEQIIKFLEDLIDTDLDELRVFYHNGGRFDIPILKEYIFNIMPVKDIKMLDIGRSVISFGFLYKGKKIVMVDSLKLLGCAVRDMKETYGVAIEDKQHYPYEFYQKLHMMEYLGCSTIPDHENTNIEEIYNLINTKVSFQKDEMIPYMIAEMDNFIKSRPVKDVVANKYNLVKLCEDYNMSDCEIVMQGLIVFKNIFNNNKELCDLLKSLNPEYISVYKFAHKNPLTGEYIDICMERREHINPLNCLTIPSFVNKILKEENIFEGAYKVRQGLADYINNNVRGGQVYSTKDPTRKKFISRDIDKIVRSKYFHIHPKFKDVIETLSRYGYDKNKPLLRYKINDPPEEVKELKKLLEKYGNCLVDCDGVSLYPSAISMSLFPTGAASKFTNKMFISWQLNNNSNDKITWVGTFKIKVGKTIPGRKDSSGNIVEPFPMLTIKTPLGKKVVTDSVDSYSMDNISFIEFRKYYPDAEYTFLNGIYWEGTSDKFSKIIKVLFDLRLYFKSLKMTAVANQIKLLLNSAFGKLIQKEKFTVTNFLSKYGYNAEHAKWAAIYKKVVKNNEIKFKDRDDCYTWFLNGCPMPKNDVKATSQNRIQQVFVQCRDDILNELRILRDGGDHKEKYLQEMVFKVIWEKLKAECKNDYEKYVRKNAHLMENLEQLTVACANITDIVKRYEETRVHESMPHWAMILLSNSKKLMNDMMELIGWDIYYTDTDSIHCDGSYMLDPKVQNMIGEKLCQFHSDFSVLELNPHDKKDGLKPLHPVIGLCSILSLFGGKKKYLDTVVGVNVDEVDEEGNKLGYITASFHKKFNGANAKRLTFNAYERYINGEPIVQDVLASKPFGLTVNKTHGVTVSSTSLGHSKMKEFKNEDVVAAEKKRKLAEREERKISKALSNTEKKLAKETLLQLGLFKL